MAEKTKDEIAIIEVTEEYLQDKLYDIRGYKVILDADLAAIYGYENKRFNELVQRADIILMCSLNRDYICL